MFLSMLVSLEGYLHDNSRMAWYVEPGGGVGREGEGNGGTCEEFGGFDIL